MGNGGYAYVGIGIRGAEGDARITVRVDVRILSADL